MKKTAKKMDWRTARSGNAGFACAAEAIPGSYGMVVMALAAITALFILMALTSSAYAVLDIKAEYLYDLEGLTEDSHFQSQGEIFSDPERNEIYVADTGNHCIRIFGKEGLELFQFGENGELGVPLDVAVTKSGDIYVLQGGFGGRNIDVFDYRGKRLSRLELKGLPEGDTCEPTDIALDSQDNLYISDQKHGCIVSFDSDGQYRFKIMPTMNDKDREEAVFGSLSVDKNNRVYLPVATLGTVYVFNNEGKHLMNFGIQGGGPGRLAFPVDVVVDKGGRYLVLDKQRHCIAVYDRDGNYLTEFGGMGPSKGWFYYPNSLEIDRYGRIYVSQMFGNKVQVLKLKEENR
ncbi:NHL repeat-containing protein [Candidatus Poribacteria bacterium]|nr:NHL repeat-containing protein [Candidatus Poribacteria bacterium]